MLPYLIAGVIGYGISKLFEDNKAPKYADGGRVNVIDVKQYNIKDRNYRLVEIAEKKYNKIELYRQADDGNYYGELLYRGVPRYDAKFSSPMVNDINQLYAYEPVSNKELFNAVKNKKKPFASFGYWLSYYTEEEIQKEIQSFIDECDKYDLEYAVEKISGENKSLERIQFQVCQKGTFDELFDIDALIEDYANNDFDSYDIEKIKEFRYVELSYFLNNEWDEHYALTGLILGIPPKFTMSLLNMWRSYGLRKKYDYTENIVVIKNNNTDIRFMAGGNVPKTSKDEYGNWSGEYLGNKFSIYKLNEGWKFSFTYYSPLIQSEKNYFSSDDFSPFKTKKDAVNTLLEKIKEINEENESIIAQRKSKFNDGGLIKLNDFNKKVKGELKKSDYDYAKTIDEKRKVITFLYAHEYYQINNIIPLAEPDDDIIYWQLVSINGKEYIIGIYLTFHDFDNRLKITDSEITFYDVDYNELPNPIKMEEGGLIAPNGKPSNLTPEQYKLVRTPEFKAWFGDWENDPENSSKVVDENGEPLVVYRGDSSKTNIFKGITFFSSNDYVAGSYSNEDAIPEYKVFLNIRNPLNLLGGNELRRTPNSARILGSDPNVVNIFKEAILNLPNDYTISVGYGDKWDKKTLYELVIKNYEGIEYINYNNQSASWEAIIKYAKTKGFDGVFMNDESQDRLIQFQFSQITFEPEQIKLADGTNTTFDGNNPDIRYADGGYIRNIKKLYTEDDSDVYGGDFGQAGGINWRINPETNFLYLMGIGRNNRGENSVKSKGEGSRALAYLFELYPEVDKIYFEIEGEEGAWKFYKKIGAEEEGGGKITENTYNAELSRTALRNYFVKKNNPDIRFDGGGNLK